MSEVARIFSSFQKHLNREQDIREKIQAVVKKIEKCSNEIYITLQNIHNHDKSIEENKIVSEYCAKSRNHFEDVRHYYEELATIVPKYQYYRFNNQWRTVTQRLCFLASLIIYLEVKILATRETVAELLGLKCSHEEGFHMDIEEYLMGLFELSSELTRFAANSVPSGDYDRVLEISYFIKGMDVGFCSLNIKNDDLTKGYNGLKNDLKKIEGIMNDLRMQTSNSTEENIEYDSAEQSKDKPENLCVRF